MQHSGARLGGGTVFPFPTFFFFFFKSSFWRPAEVLGEITESDCFGLWIRIAQVGAVT